MPAEAPEIEIAIADNAWDAALLESAAIQGAALAFQAADVPATNFTISLLATDDTQITALNKGYRGKDGPTNVLSWPAHDLAPATPGAHPSPPPGPPTHFTPDERQELGDIALARETVAREAQEQGISLQFHLTHLILHGVLHLLGYDHQTDADAAVMEGLERKALVEAGFHDPYANEGAT